MAVNGKSAAVIAAGSIFVYSGLKGYSILKAAQNVIQGKSPSEGQTASLLSSGGSGGNTGGANSASATGGPGGTLSSSQISQLWISNGGDPSKASVAVCIAMHESGGRATVTSPNPNGGTNVGLWQLDTTGVGSGHSVSELQGSTNLQAKITIQGSRNGTNWGPWSTAPMCGV